MTIVSPSLLAADFLHLQKDIEMINNSNADWLHLDIMDGVFVPNLSFGFSILEAICTILKKPMDIHFMNVNPQDYIERAAKLGAASINFHVEAAKENTGSYIKQIHDCGVKAAITISPDTPVEAVRPYIKDVEMVLIMGVYPGFGGQKFIEATIDRVRELRKMIEETGSKALIEVDGGVQGETAPRLVEAGCDALVSGSYVFQAKDPFAAVDSLRNL